MLDMISYLQLFVFSNNFDDMILFVTEDEIPSVFFIHPDQSF